SFCAMTRFSSFGSIYGPFFNERLIMLLFLPFKFSCLFRQGAHAALLLFRNNELRGSLFRVAGLVAFGEQTFARTRMSAGGTTLAATHGVVHRVHGHTAVVRPAAQPAAAARLAVLFEAVVGIRHGADGCAAGGEYHAGFTRRKFDNSIFAFACQKLRVGTGAAGHCGTLTGIEFYGVYHRTERYFGQRKRIAHFRCGARSADDGLPYLQSVRSEDITLLSVGIDDEGDACRTVRVVFDGLHRSSHAVVGPLEVDDTVHLLVAAAAVAYGHLAAAVAAAGAFLRFEQRLFGSALGRSEERRVGKECRYWWAP